VRWRPGELGGYELRVRAVDVYGIWLVDATRGGPKAAEVLNEAGGWAENP